MAENQLQKKRNYKILGAESFGAVISPALPNTENGTFVNYPGNVTKLFYHSDDKEKLVGKIPNIKRLFKSDPSYRINNYTHKYKYKNLPDDIVSELEKKAYIKPDFEIHAVRMPYLGIDFKDSKLEREKEKLQRIPVLKIVSEIVKLFSQTLSLYREDWIHGDIRERNIMINPDTGVMTIIDFDWLKPFDDFYDKYSFGFYSNPPEFLLHHEAGDDIETYVLDNLNQFKAYFKLLGYDRKSLKHMFRKANEENERLKDEEYGDQYDFFMDSLNTFDNYGLGLSLQTLFSHLYPSCVQTAVPEGSDPTKIQALRETISDDGRPYNDDELVAIESALRQLSYLCYRVSHPEYSRRPLPDAAFQEARAIYERLKTSLEAGSRNELRRLALLAGNMGVLPAIHGGVRRSKTYKRRSRLRKTRRQARL
jgi:serine/threonine protein kinase